MHDIENAEKEVSLARRELKNIRQEVMKLKANFRDETENIKLLFPKLHSKPQINSVKDQKENSFKMIPVGFISSCFKNKNGIPRQSLLCESAKASLEINKTFFTNPEHSLIGLKEFPYIWILFVFNKNAETSVKAKVHPPRLNGKSVGVFSTRSPHRPCAIGLSLIKLDEIKGNVLYLSGVDILDGTPVLDIKPYIASYDTPKLHRNPVIDECFESLLKEPKESKIQENASTECINCSSSLKSHLHEKTNNTYSKDLPNFKENCLELDMPAKRIQTLLEMPSSQLEVLFTERANQDIEKFHPPDHGIKCDYCLHLITDPQAAKQAIKDILRNDPRSVYRKTKCLDKLYFFEIDKLHITSWFDDTIAEVLRVKPIKECQTKNLG